VPASLDDAPKPNVAGGDGAPVFAISPSNFPTQ